jgi:hypothetical protein
LNRALVTHPLIGQIPYALSTGSIQIAGQSQSLLGVLAKTEGEHETNSSIPAGNLGSDFYLPELNVVTLACGQTSTLNRVDDGASSGIADDAAGFPVLIRAASKVIRITVENGISPDYVRGQGRHDVQLSIFDEGVGG